MNKITKVPTKPVATKAPVKAHAPAAKPKVATTTVKKPTGTTKPLATQSVPVVEQPIKLVINVQKIKIPIKQMDYHILKDSEGKIQNENKWPFVIDNESNVAQTFFRHSANYGNTFDYEFMNSDRLRKSLLGAIRYGKPFVLDLENRDAENWNIVEESFNKIQEGLLGNLINKKLLENDKFLEIRKEEDGPEYDDYSFNRTDSFRFILLSVNRNLDDAFLNKFIVYEIE